VSVSEQGVITGRLFVLAGPSGVGKDTILRAVLAADSRLCRVVTLVTRAPRASETDGVDHYFVTREEFARRTAAGDLLEWAEYVGSPRGTPRSGVVAALKSRREPILKIDVQGFRQIRAALPQVISIFILPPSLQSLERRLRGSGPGESRDAVQGRVEAAKQEIAAAEEFDYRIVNPDGDPARCVSDVLELIRFERERDVPRLVTLDV